VVNAGSYILSVALLALLVLSLGFSAVRLRQRLMPDWEGAPAHLVEAVVGVALLIWIAELLGLVNLLYAGTLVTASLLLAAAVAFGPRVLSGRGGAGASLGFSPGSPSPVRDGERGEKEDAAVPRHPLSPPPAGAAMTAVAVGVVALVFAHWGVTTADALSRGIFNFDSLWYHMPFAVEMAQSHSVTGLHYTETVFTNWFYPQNSELLHAVGILIADRDTFSLFLNLGWLAMAFLAAWCIGRPYGKGPLTVVAAGILLECHTLVVREPGAAKNDVMAAALLLAAIAILINAWVARDGEEKSLSPGWPLAAAGLAVGLAVGTKSTALAMAAALTVAIVFLAPAGRRWAAAGWWFAAGLAGGGYWYLRNLAISGNPLPQLEHLGPITLPHPEQLQTGRPDFSIAHYATDTGVWSEYFGPELHEAFGLLWPLVILAAIAGGITALLWGPSRVLRWIGGVALFGMLAYLFTPLSAAGVEGAPEGFGINLRYAVPALLAGITLLPLSHVPVRRGPYGPLRTGTWVLLGGLALSLVVTNRADVVVRDPDRLFGWAIALLFVLIPAVLLFARSRGVSRGAVGGGIAALALLVAAIGYPVQRDYLGDRFLNTNADAAIPGMHLDSAYRWARDVGDARIGLAGTTAGFLQYGFYGTDLSNRVRYLGVEGPHGSFRPIQTCAGFRAAVNAADLDYLVTAPFLNFIEPGEPVLSPEAGWLRGEPAVVSIDRDGPVTVWRVQGRLDPRGCGALNRPLRAVPQQPGATPTFEDAGPILDRNVIAILGDSYSAGEGTDLYLRGTDTEDNPCHRSLSTYLAQAFDIPASRIVACSGAVAADVLSPQPARTEAAQIVQLEDIHRREGVDAVVLTLGGNDAGFADIGASCLVPGRGGCARFIHTGPFPHSRAQPSDAFVDERLRALPSLLRPAYLAIDEAVNGPDAKPAGPVPILVLGYPAATPAAPVQCGRMHGLISPEEIGFLNDLSQRLNGTIADTVAATRAKRQIPIFYVGDTETAFRPDHSICDPVSYVRRPSSFNGAGPRILRQGIRELLHPNPAGYAAMSRAILRWSRSQAAADALTFLESASPAARRPPLTSSG
jgi:lysophospholipase L1-like esterase